MKKLLTILALVITVTLSAQTYSTASLSVYNGAGSFAKQAMPTLEVGRYLQSDFTAGIAVGTTAFKGGSAYAEFRPTLYYASNKFSQGFTIGGGYVFNKDTHFLVEVSTSTNYQISNDWGVGVFVGQYNFNGKSHASEYTFGGISVTCIIPKK